MSTTFFPLARFDGPFLRDTGAFVADVADGSVPLHADVDAARCTGSEAVWQLDAGDALALGAALVRAGLTARFGDDADPGDALDLAAALGVIGPVSSLPEVD